MGQVDGIINDFVLALLVVPLILLTVVVGSTHVCCTSYHRDLCECKKNTCADIMRQQG